jgi:hypothetical protein
MNECHFPDNTHSTSGNYRNPAKKMRKMRALRQLFVDCGKCFSMYRKNFRIWVDIYAPISVSLDETAPKSCPEYNPATHSE